MSNDVLKCRKYEIEEVIKSFPDNVPTTACLLKDGDIKACFGDVNHIKAVKYLQLKSELKEINKKLGENIYTVSVMIYADIDVEAKSEKEAKLLVSDRIDEMYNCNIYIQDIKLRG